MKKKNLYSLLGVDKSCDKKSIKNAYRKKAKKEHPDAGGSVEKFGAIKIAYDVLMDDERRSKYDTTGEIDEKTPDNAYSHAVNAVAIAFGLVLQKCAEQGKSPLEMDIVKSVSDTIKSQIAENNKQIRIMRGILSYDRSMRGRFKVANGDNVFESILSSRISSLELGIKTTEKTIHCQEDGLALIKESSYRHDSPQYESPGDRMASLMGYA